ncbi:hypothetical protein AEGHOMDF_6102 [Methylobacterium soli]|nr:hypothetical protein AEGHOMDF_6102 [Methylobacterium soli]
MGGGLLKLERRRGDAAHDRADRGLEPVRHLAHPGLALRVDPGAGEGGLRLQRAGPQEPVLEHLDGRRHGADLVAPRAARERHVEVAGGEAARIGGEARQGLGEMAREPHRHRAAERAEHAGDPERDPHLVLDALARGGDLGLRLGAGEVHGLVEPAAQLLAVAPDQLGGGDRGALADAEQDLGIVAPARRRRPGLPGDLRNARRHRRGPELRDVGLEPGHHRPELRRDRLRLDQVRHGQHAGHQAIAPLEEQPCAAAGLVGRDIAVRQGRHPGEGRLSPEARHRGERRREEQEGQHRQKDLYANRHRRLRRSLGRGRSAAGFGWGSGPVSSAGSAGPSRSSRPSAT